MRCLEGLVFERLIVISAKYNSSFAGALVGDDVIIIDALKMGPAHVDVGADIGDPSGIAHGVARYRESGRSEGVGVGHQNFARDIPAFRPGKERASFVKVVIEGFSDSSTGWPSALDRSAYWRSRRDEWQGRVADPAGGRDDCPT